MDYGGFIMLSYGKKVTLFALFIALLVTGCDQREQTSQPAHQVSSTPPKITLSIISGSENKGLEPILQRFAKQNNLAIQMRYMGSVDISQEIGKGSVAPFDAVWPASSLWLSLGDTQGAIRHAKSIMRSPVVFALKRSVVQQLGWDKKDVTVMDILGEVEKGNIRFAMTSATQSNSGASAFFGFLSAFAGGPDVLTSKHLNDPQVVDKIKRFLRTVNRSSGSSGWLKEMMVKDYLYFDGMINYEALVIEVNRELVASGREPLYAIYPVDGLSIADSPLALVNKGDKVKETAFLKLQEYLLSKSVQDEIQALGRRTGLIGMQADAANSAVFNPAWGIDVNRILTPVRTPSSQVVSEALNLYQTAFRKPSLTAYVLDYSGSMEGVGSAQLKKAMRTLLDERIAKTYLLQASAEDVTIVIPFNDHVVYKWQAEGNTPAAMNNLLNKIEALQPGGGTNMYLATIEAMRLLKPLAASGKFHTSIIVMSDGESDGHLKDLLGALPEIGVGRDIPVFTILFGQARKDQMQALANGMSGRMFDGRKDVIKAFREAKGYN